MAEPMRRHNAHDLTGRMPDDSTCDDLMNEAYVRQVIERGLANSRAGKTADVSEVRRKYGLEQ